MNRASFFRRLLLGVGGLLGLHSRHSGVPDLPAPASVCASGGFVKWVDDPLVINADAPMTLSSITTSATVTGYPFPIDFPCRTLRVSKS